MARDCPKGKGASKDDSFITEFKRAKTGRGMNSRLCGDLSQLQNHLKKFKTGFHHGKNCAECGLEAFSKCELCGV